MERTTGQTGPVCQDVRKWTVSSVLRSCRVTLPPDMDGQLGMGNWSHCEDANQDELSPTSSRGYRIGRWQVWGNLIV